MKCIFCNKKLNGKFRKDYILLTWCDNPKDPTSATKIAKPAHKTCFYKFIMYNVDKITTHETNLQNVQTPL